MYTDLHIEHNTDPGGSTSRVWAMNGENWLLVTDEPGEFEFKFKDFRKITHHLEDSIEYTPIS
jgi:hypothetical protein